MKKNPTKGHREKKSYQKTYEILEKKLKDILYSWIKKV